MSNFKGFGAGLSGFGGAGGAGVFNLGATGAAAAAVATTPEPTIAVLPDFTELLQLLRRCEEEGNVGQISDWRRLLDQHRNSLKSVGVLDYKVCFPFI
jgi:hypothetical protein